MLSKTILYSMKEFDGYDEERELFEEIKEPVESIIDRILEQVEVK